MLEGIPYKVSGLFNKVVNFECPKCHVPLSAALRDAAREDECPHCGHKFISPGSKTLEIDVAMDAQKKAAKAGAPAQNPSAPPRPPWCAGCGKSLPANPYLYDGGKYCESCYIARSTPSQATAATAEVTRGITAPPNSSGDSACGNCGETIGKLEKPCSWGATVVCFECHERLVRQNTSPSMPSANVVDHSRREFREQAKITGKETGKAVESVIAKFILAFILLSCIPILLNRCSH